MVYELKLLNFCMSNKIFMIVWKCQKEQLLLLLFSRYSKSIFLKPFCKITLLAQFSKPFLRTNVKKTKAKDTNKKTEAWILPTRSQLTTFDQIKNWWKPCFMFNQSCSFDGKFFSVNAPVDNFDFGKETLF